MSNIKPEHAKIINWVKERMKEKGLTKKEMVIPGGVHYQTLAATMRGHIEPGTKFYTTIATIFNVPLEEIMQIAGQKPVLITETGKFYDPDAGIDDFVDWIKIKMNRLGIDSADAFFIKSDGRLSRQAMSGLLNRKINAGVKTCIGISYVLDIPLDYVRKKAGHPTPGMPVPKDLNPIIAKMNRLRPSDIAMVEQFIDRFLGA